MKYLSILFMSIIISSVAAEGIDRSNQFVFKTELKGYTCERWGKKGFKTSTLEEEQGYKFVTLDISRNTRRTRINMAQTEGACTYTALFDREKGNTFVTFTSSTITSENAQSCTEMKADLDELFSQGWNYKIEMNKYLSVQFPYGISSQCDETTGETFARFNYNIML